jgi:hypothetical protein
MKEFDNDTRAKNIINCLADYRYRLKRQGLSTDEVEKRVAALVHASDDESLKERKEKKLKRNANAVRKHRFNKETDGWVCPDYPDV